MKVFAELNFALCLGQVVVAFEADSLGHIGIEFIQRTYARLFKHLLQVVPGMGEILIGSPTPVPSPKGEGRQGLLLFVVWIHFEIVF